jgi:NifU-like protein involved in Fe-S cluster formation
VRFHLQVLDGVVNAARFQAYGCPHTLAACAWVAGRLPGRIAAQGLGSTPHDWARELEVPTEKLSRLLVVEDAVLAAMRAAGMPVE